MSTIYCRLSYGTLSFRPETISVPSDTLFQVSGLPANKVCELIVAHPQTLAPLAKATIQADGTCRINTNTEPFRDLFEGRKGQRITVLVQIGNATELLANGMVSASYNLLAGDEVPEAPTPDTRFLTDADYRDLASSIAAAQLQASEDTAALTVRLDEQGNALKEKADAVMLAAVTERVNALEKAPAVDEAVLMRVRSFDPATATVDGLWQQVADLSAVLSAILAK